MALKPPMIGAPDQDRRMTGFYRGFSVDVRVVSKIIISVLVVWCIFWPIAAGEASGHLEQLYSCTICRLVYLGCGVFVIVCLGLAIWPTAGRVELGKPGEKPEFSNFSWFSMMFGAGIGVGMLTWAVAEPIAHFQESTLPLFKG